MTEKPISESDLLENYVHPSGHAFGDPLADSTDLEDYFKRSESNALSYGELMLFDVRMLQLFCRKVYAGESPPAWLMNSIANSFYSVLSGLPWEEELPLPWRPSPSNLTRAQKRQLDIYCALMGSKQDNPESSWANRVEAIAAEFCCSVKTVEAAHTYWNKERSAARADIERKGTLDSNPEI